MPEGTAGAAALRQDGYFDVFAGYARQRDARLSRLSGVHNADLYAADGLAALIVDRMAEDATAPGFDVEGDADEDVLNEYDRLEGLSVLTEALCFSRLEGAAAVLVLSEDAGALDQPLNPDTLQALTGLVAFPMGALAPGAEIYADPRRLDFGQPTTYRLSPGNGASFVVHESRLLRFFETATAGGYGRQALRLPGDGSVLNGCRDDLSHYRAVLRLTREIMRRKQQAVHKMSGLAEQLAAGMDAIVAKRIERADAVRDLMNMVTVDAEDDFTVIDLGLDGVGDAYNAACTALSASTGYPKAVLFGDDIKGLGSLGTGERAIYGARVSRVRERVLRPGLERLVSLIWSQAPLRAKQPRRWRVAYRPIWQPTEAEVAKAALDKANARKAEVESLGALLDLRIAGPEAILRYASKAWPEYELSAADLPDFADLPDETGADTLEGAAPTDA